MSTQFHNMLESDLALVFADSFSSSEEIELIEENGKSYLLKAFFEAPSTDVNAGTAPVVMLVPTLHVQASVIQRLLGRQLSNKDTLTFRNKSYKVQKIQDDGFGLIKIKLLERGGF